VDIKYPGFKDALEGKRKEQGVLPRNKYLYTPTKSEEPERKKR